MEPQNQIKRALCSPDGLGQVRRLLGRRERLNRTQVADRLCERFGFFDPGGSKQRSGCLKALREMERQGQFTLPAPQWQPGPKSPRRLSRPVPAPQDVPEDAGSIGQLSLVRVETQAQMRLWNEMMIREHPRGAGPLVGRQLRYLVSSEHGWLGAIGFGAAALQLQARDRWIGWDAQTRRAHLHQVVCLSRLLIRTDGKCRNLASRVLGMSLRALPGDFQSRYGYRPLLVESFVDGLAGTCYRAANWVWVGRTQGRGRQDRFTRRAETIKDIYLYALDKDFRSRLGLPEPLGMRVLGPADGADADGWAEQEFGDAPLGDKRLSRRLVEVARQKAEKPDHAFCSVVGGEWPKVKAYYRLIDRPDDSAVTMANILAPHRERTMERMQGQEVVLCIQDGTDLDYSSLDQCEGLGVIGTNQTGAQSRGLHLHSTLAVTTEGLPLGIVRAQCTAPEPKSEDRKPSGATAKKTFCWIEGLRDSMELAGRMPHTRLVCVMDREADFFELFDAHQGNPCVDLLVRAKHDRRTPAGLNLFDTVWESPVQSRLSIQVPRQSARAKKSKQKARTKRPARTAELALRYTQVQLSPTPSCKQARPITVWVVHVVEENPPEEAGPVEWYLITTVDLKSPEDAIRCVRWYCLRWRIEDWHRVLKSGCRIEEIGHHSGDRLQRAIAINLVIAWRVMLMTLLGRETPELPADVLFSDLEVQVLQAYAKRRRLSVPALLGDAVRLVARIGGYLARASDPPPGHQLMWQGYTQLHLMCEGFALRDDRGSSP